MKLFKSDPKAKRSSQSKLSSYGKKKASSKKNVLRKATSKRPPYTVKQSKRQVGTTDRKLDKKRKSMKPGRRISASGRAYTENRKNRSDLKGGI